MAFLQNNNIRNSGVLGVYRVSRPAVQLNVPTSDDGTHSSFSRRSLPILVWRHPQSGQDNSSAVSSYSTLFPGQVPALDPQVIVGAVRRRVHQVDPWDGACARVLQSFTTQGARRGHSLANGAGRDA